MEQPRLHRHNIDASATPPPHSRAFRCTQHLLVAPQPSTTFLIGVLLRHSDVGFATFARPIFSWVIFLAPNIGKSLLPQCSPHKVITCARSPRAGVHSVFPGFRHVKIWLQTRTHPCLCSAMHINLIVRKTAKATRSNQLQITHFIKYTDMKKKTSKKSEAPLKEVVEQAVEQIT